MVKNEISLESYIKIGVPKSGKLNHSTISEICSNFKLLPYGKMYRLNIFLQTSLFTLIMKLKGLSLSNLCNLFNRPGQLYWGYTMWKFQDFPTAQILREINFGHFWSPKNCHLPLCSRIFQNVKLRPKIKFLNFTT